MVLCELCKGVLMLLLLIWYEPTWRKKKYCGKNERKKKYERIPNGTWLCTSQIEFIPNQGQRRQQQQQQQPPAAPADMKNDKKRAHTEWANKKKKKRIVKWLWRRDHGVAVPLLNHTQSTITLLLISRPDFDSWPRPHSDTLNATSWYVVFRLFFSTILFPNKNVNVNCIYIDITSCLPLWHHTKPHTHTHTYTHTHAQTLTLWRHSDRMCARSLRTASPFTFQTGFISLLQYTIIYIIIHICIRCYHTHAYIYSFAFRLGWHTLW